MAPFRSRKYVFTWNNYPVNYQALLDLIPSSYIVAAEEVAPTTNTPHLQGFVYFPHAKSASAVRSIFPGCHVEAANGTPKQADDYCRKTRPVDEEPNEVVYSRGTVPLTQAEKGEAEVSRWEDAWAAAVAGEYCTLISKDELMTSQPISDYVSTPRFDELSEISCRPSIDSLDPAEYGLLGWQEVARRDQSLTSFPTPILNPVPLGGTATKEKKSFTSTMLTNSTSALVGASSSGQMPIPLSRKTRVEARRSARNGLSLQANIESRKFGQTKKPRLHSCDVL